MKKADGWSMGQEEQKKRHWRKSCGGGFTRRRLSGAAAKGKSRGKAGTGVQRTAGKQPFITEEERKPFAVRRGGETPLQGKGGGRERGSRGRAWGEGVAGLGAWPGQARRAGEPPGGAAENPAQAQETARGAMLWRAAPEHGAGRAGRGAACRAGAGRARLCA